MAESPEKNHDNIVDQAVQQFLDAQLQGQEPNIDEFVKSYPGLEHQIRQKIGKIQRIDGLFSCLMQSDDSDFGETIAEHDLVGQKLGDFEVLSLIGTGGMGAVFFARQISLDREVALKVISDVSGARKRTLERFKREAKLLAKISHPNIVSIYEVGEQGPYSYFAMEYIKGASLDTVLRSIRNAGPNEKASDVMRKCLEGQAGIYDDRTEDVKGSNGAEIDTDYIVTTSRMIISIASALDYTHNKGILHRDVKPSNILIDSGGTAKLVDFGLAKAQTQQSITITGEFFGTPSYVSPEQIRKPETVDSRSDVYSLAAANYECLTLHPPFEGDTVNETLTRVISREAVPPKKYCPRLSMDFNTVLLHALEKSPEDRYQTAAEFAADIANLLEFKPITAKRPSITQRAYKAVRRNPLKIAIVGISILVIVLGYFLFSSYMQVRNKTAAKELYDIALRRHQIGEFSEALKYYKKAIETNPVSAEAYCGLGMCYYALGQHQKSIEAYQQAVRVEPDNTIAYYILGSTYNDLGRYEEGAQVLKKTIEIDADNANAYNNLGLAYINLGRYEEAIKTLNKAIEVHPDNAYAHNNLGLAYDNLGHLEEAAQAFQRSIEINPNVLLINNNLGRIYNNLGRYEDAIQISKSVVTISPNNAQAHCDLGDAYRGLGRFEKAIIAYRQVLSIEPNDAIAYNNLGLAYNNLGRHTEAIKAIKHAIRISPNDAKAYSNLSLAYNGSGQHEEAIETLKQALRLDPNSAVSYYNLGTFYNDLGRYTEALQAFKHALQIRPNDAQTYSNIAVSFEGLGRYEEAEEAYKQAIDVEPDHAGVYNNFGIFYGRMGRYEKGIEFLKQSVSIDSNNIVTYNNLAFAYNQLKQYDEAIQVCKRAISVNPNNTFAYNELGIANRGLGRYEEAITCHKQVIEIDPNNIIAFGHLAIIYAALGRHEETIEVCNSAIGIDPNNAETYSNLGAAYLRKGLYQEAANALEKYLTFDPNRAFVLVSLAASYTNLGRFEDSIKVALKAIELDPKNAAAYSMLGISYQVLRNHQEAANAFEKSIEIDPNNPIYAGRALLYAQSLTAIGKYQEAVVFYKQAMELDPNNEMSYASLGFCQAKLGNYKEAIRYYEQAIQLKTDYLEAYFEVIIIYEGLYRHDMALQYAVKAIEIAPEKVLPMICLSAWSYNLSGYTIALKNYLQTNDDKLNDVLRGLLNYCLGEAYSFSENHDLARYAYKKSQTIYQQMTKTKLNDAYAFWGLGCSCYGLKQYQVAIDAYEHSIKADPNFPASYKMLSYLYATCPEAKFRNGKEAVKLAQEAWKLTNYANNSCIVALAAAYAEYGNFEKAIEYQVKAIEFTEGDVREECKKRLEAYKANKPWRE